MIYWRIRQPGKSWSCWQDGTADDVDEAQRDAILAVLDDDNQLLPWAQGGVTVEMWNCIDIDDYVIDANQAKAFRTNYLGLAE